MWDAENCKSRIESTMDVQPGHCWRCEKPLPDSSVPCDVCSVAKYCKTSCKSADTARHQSVECQMFGPRQCTTCGKMSPSIRECAGCHSACYCNKECQRKNWKVHKPSCCKFQDQVRKLSEVLRERNITTAQNTRVGNSPHYLGNTMAEDFLKLSDNEWSEAELTDEQVSRDFHILSAGCGDLRNTVLTASSLPDKYQGNLHVTLNDYDPFVMARNVLFFYMLAQFAETEGIASSLTTIWYSLQLPQKEYDLTKTSLDKLTQMRAGDLIAATHGLVTVSDEDIKYLGQVWLKWQSLECGRGKKASIHLKRQRQKVLEYFKEDVSLYLNKLSTEDKKHMTEWFDHALFLPHATKKSSEVPFDNPTLTGIVDKVRRCQLEPKDYPFVYCNEPSSPHPFMAWDCLRVRESIPSSTSPMVMYHEYVTSLLQNVCHLISQHKLHIHISLANCINFPRHHQDMKMPNYDRIFTSNVADYLGIARLLQTFKPLLNCNNCFSTIVTENMNWFPITPLADVKCELTQEFIKLILAYHADTHKLVPNRYNDLREYYNNTVSFLLYLQAQIMAGGQGIPPLKDVPSLTAVMNYHGMKMHDFRKGPNRLVPFQYRMNARDLTLMNGTDRAVEWRLPDAKNQAK